MGKVYSNELIEISSKLLISLVSISYVIR